MTTINFPDGLPAPLRSGYNINHVSTIMSSDLQSGRARKRRRYTSVPSMVNVTWLLTQNQAAIFEAWFKYTISDGVEWFNSRLLTPVGLTDYECRFTDMYSGPELVGKNLFRFTAQLEIRERQVLDEYWLTAGYEYIFNADIFDYAVNKEWPT
jgi:hypothetical protein